MTVVIRQNEHGMAVWKHKHNKVLFAQRDYEWCDRIIVLDETENRRIVDDQKFSTFDFSDWTPMTEAEYKSVQGYFKEIYGLPCGCHCAGGCGDPYAPCLQPCPQHRCF